MTVTAPIGYGDGDGYGDGSGSGSGSGYGDGSGSGSSKYYEQIFAESVASVPEGATAVVMWKSDANGQPSNNGKPMEPAAPGVVHTSPGPLNLCQSGTLHATMNPEKWKGDRLWVVALFGEVAWENDKCGALKREILFEVTA